MSQYTPTPGKQTETLAEAVEKHVNAQTLSAIQLQKSTQLQSTGTGRH